MARANTVRAILALTVVAGSAWLAATQPPRLGLDLRGGTQITLETRDGELARATAETTDDTMEVLRRRIDELGVTEPALARSGERRIIVELPGVTDPQQAVEVIGRTAQLTFHPVLGLASGEGGGDQDGLPDEHGQRLRLGPAAVAGQQVERADAGIGELSAWQVELDFRGPGDRAWAELTGRAACSPLGDPTRRVAIVLDDRVLSSPPVDPGVPCGVGIAGGSTVITGSFSEAEAKELALLIRAGALPVPVDVIEQRSVGPTLGKAAIEASALAAMLGTLATIAFIVAVYRLAGAAAAVALVGYGLISYAALLAIGATLTLPGLAGFVLAIGMAVDANVLVFERAREEFAAGRPSLRTAARGGFTHAWSAIADSNVTTLLAAGLLFFLASGPVRGFGVTLSIGVLASMFSALVVTRALLAGALGPRFLGRRPALSGLADAGWVRRTLVRRRPDLMGRRRLWLVVSGVAVLLAAGGIAARGLDVGVEFTGGRLVEYATSRPVSVDAAREAVDGAGVRQAVVNTAGEGNLSVRAGSFDDAAEGRVRAALTERGAGEVQRVRDELIGPSLGAELRRNAIVALGVALLAQLTYLAIRFHWQWGAAAVTAMFHDVVILTGVFAWLGRPVDGVFLAALLTVIGYSVNDSVVVFDRLRELVRGRRGASFARLANDACLQTVPRTVNTGLGAVFILTALALLGAGSLVDFALAVLIGVAVGTYSSVFLATPLAVILHTERR